VPIILTVIVLIVALVIGYAAGRARRGIAPPSSTIPGIVPSAELGLGELPLPEVAPVPAPAAAPLPPTTAVNATVDERSRIMRSYEAEAALLRRAMVSRDAANAQLSALAGERGRLFEELADARAETARYRQLVIDLENNAAPPFFGVGAPDDLKLIVGVGPVLERMLQMMGVATYRQIARWSERDIDEFDAKLHEFPGRIRRDAWVTQARALHQSKYGEVLPLRERG